MFFPATLHLPVPHFVSLNPKSLLAILELNWLFLLDVCSTYYLSSTSFLFAKCMEIVCPLKFPCMVFMFLGILFVFLYSFTIILKKILHIYFQREGKGGGKRGRETLMWERNIDWSPLARPQLSTWPTTHACALTWN